MISAKSESKHFVKANDAKAFTVSVLAEHNVSKEDASIVVDCLVEADLRGVQTHGLARLPIYVERLKHKMMNPNPKMTLNKITAVCASLDGNNGFGFLVGRRGMAEAINMAENNGVGIVAARNSNHFGMAASYLLQAIEAGYFAFVFSNAAASMPPWGASGVIWNHPVCCWCTVQ